MTVKNFSMMLVGMMMLGTTAVFGKTNATVNNDRHGRTEVVVVNNHHKGMDRMVDHRHMTREMDRFMVKHILDGRHVMNHHGECNVCHMNRHEIKRVERELRHHAPRPVVKASHFGR